ncbi:MAG: acylphosphatase [Bacteroidetes bacterium]|nr:acylphosphatase [Bacteroidota bacterium]
MEQEEKGYEIVIYGRVQGVGFRYAACDQARRLGLKGWVENRPDGSVRTRLEGPPEACNTYIRWCRTGPGYSWVERIDLTDLTEKTNPPLSHFMIR